MSITNNSNTHEKNIENQDIFILQKAFKSLHNDFKEKTAQLVKEGFFKEFGINKDYYNRLLSFDGEMNNLKVPNPVKVVSRIVLKLCDKHNIELEFDEKDQIKFNMLEKNGEKVESVLYKQVKASKKLKDKNKIKQFCYLLYYWRKDDIIENRIVEHQEIAVSYLQLLPESETAELIILYSSGVERKLTGTYESLEEHIYINLYDIKQKGAYSFKVSIVIHLSDQTLSLETYKWFSYNTADRSEKLPNAGIGYMEYYQVGKDWKRDLKKKHIEVGIKPDIYYMLYKNRLIAPSDKPNSSYYPPLDNIKLLEHYEGVYQGINMQNYRGDIVTFGMTLRKNGQVIIRTKNKINNPSPNTNNNFYEGMCRIIRSPTNESRMLIIDFDYNDEFKIDRLKFYLTPPEDYSSNKYLLGVRSGMYNHKPLVGRIKLKITDYKIEDFGSNSESWNKLDIRSLKFDTDLKEIETLLNEDNTKEFFLGQDGNSKFTDINIFQEFFGDSSSRLSQPKTNVVKKDEKANLDIIALVGNYELYSSTLESEEGEKKIIEYEVAENKVIKFAIDIKENAEASLKVRRVAGQNKDIVLVGKVECSESCLSITVNDNNEFIHMLFTISKPSGEGFEETKHFYGTIQKLKSGRIESRACVLVKTPEERLKSNSFKKYTLEDDEYNKIDEETKGILSFLRGPINRIIRVPSNLNPIIRPRSGETNLKKELFYAACFKAIKKDFGTTEKLLKQAYANGFGQFKFAEHEIDKIDFNILKCPTRLKDSLKKLQIERDEIRNEIKDKFTNENGEEIEAGVLSEPNIRAFIKERWKI